MGLNWSKQRSRDQSFAAARAVRDDAAYAAELQGQIERSKSELREEARAAMASYRKNILVVPREVRLRCLRCNHRGTVRLMPHVKDPRFRCRKCGARCS